MPFWYGRPFGEPNNPGLQMRVLRAALDLLSHEQGPVLETFAEEAPSTALPENWQPPIGLCEKPAEDASDDVIAEALRAEIDVVAPRHRQWCVTRGSSLVGPSGLRLDQIPELLCAYLDRREAEVDFVRRPGVALKFGCQELFDAYAESALVTSEDAPFAIRRWFWTATAAGLAIRRVADVARDSADHRSRVLAQKNLLRPREWDA